MKKLLFAVFCFSICASVSGQQCDTNALIIQPVRASDTDSNIPYELAQHYTFFNPDCTPKNKLLVHMVGTHGNPYQTLYFPKLAANNGFHVLSLKYPNDTSAQFACGGSADIDCHLKFRREIIEGIDFSPEIVVDSVNSISNRLIRLLQYMDQAEPTQNWSQFFTSDSVHWENVLLSGHSQGGGHAAVMAIDRPVNRVLMFASPNDFSISFNAVANWTSLPHVTSDSAYYSFNNTNDLVAEYAWQFDAAVNFGEANFGDTVNVETSECPFENSHNLYTNRDSSGFLVNHGMVVNDINVPLDMNGIPVFENVWRYMLGLDCSVASLTDPSLISWTVAPVPFSDRLTISGNDQLNNLQLFAPSGECVKEVNYSGFKVELDLSELNAGVYFLRIESSNQNSVVKRVVKN